MLVERGVQRVRSFLSDAKRMGRQPKGAGAIRRIDADIFPPCDLVTTVMNFAMMTATERDRELIADFPAKRAALCETQMVSVGGPPTAEQTRMCGDELHVIAITKSTRLGQMPAHSCRSIGAERVSWRLAVIGRSPGCACVGVHAETARALNRNQKASRSKKPFRIRHHQLVPFWYDAFCPQRGILSACLVR